MTEPWAPSNKDEYIDALHQAQLKTEQHRWDTAIKLQEAADEKAAKEPKTQPPEGEPKPKRRAFL